MKLERTRKSPPVSWEGIVGINPDSFDGIKRFKGVIAANFVFENFS